MEDCEIIVYVFWRAQVGEVMHGKDMHRSLYLLGRV